MGAICERTTALPAALGRGHSRMPRSRVACARVLYSIYLLPSRDVELCALPQRRMFAVGAKASKPTPLRQGDGAFRSPAFARRRVALALA